MPSVLLSKYVEVGMNPRSLEEARLVSKEGLFFGMSKVLTAVSRLAPSHQLFRKRGARRIWRLLLLEF